MMADLESAVPSPSVLFAPQCTYIGKRHRGRNDTEGDAIAVRGITITEPVKAKHHLNCMLSLQKKPEISIIQISQAVHDNLASIIPSHSMQVVRITEKKNSTHLILRHILRYHLQHPQHFFIALVHSPTLLLASLRFIRPSPPTLKYAEHGHI